MPRPPLRILAIAPYSPYPPIGGGKLRVYHLVQELLNQGHRLTVWLVPSDQTVPDWAGASARPSIRALPSRDRGTLRRKLEALASILPEEVWSRSPIFANGRTVQMGDFDVVILMQAHVGQYAELARTAGVPVILDQQNVESTTTRELARLAPTLLGRLRSRLDAWKWRRYEAQLMRDVQMVIAVSHLDADTFHEIAPNSEIVVRPNGSDLRTFDFVDHSENQADRLIMTGTLGYLPNLDAAGWLIRDILPAIRRVRPSVRLVLVGADAPISLTAINGDGVDVAGKVPDVRPYLRRADLFVAPLRAGGGTRLKLLEAFAAGLPVVATTVATEGLAVRGGVHVAIADDEESFAREVLRMLDDVETRKAISISARRLVEEGYDWRAIAAAYQEDLYRVVQARAASSS